MPAIILDNISFSYGSRTVLDRVSLSVGDGERAFLVGSNGSGKSTLLKVITGELSPDSGKIVSGMHRFRVPDPDVFTGSAGEFLDAALAPFKLLMSRFEQLTAAIAGGETGLDAEYDRTLARIGALDLWSLDARVSATLNGLGLADLTAANICRKLDSLSPGQKARLKLATLLMLRPEVLILDEPTNHLDSEAIGYLAQTIKNWEGPVLATSHDRAFIDCTATVIYDMNITVWRELARLDGQKIEGVYRNAGSYSDYFAAKAAAQEKYRSIHAAQQAQKREIREHRHKSMKISRGGIRVQTAAPKEKKFFTDRAAKTSVKRTRYDDVRLERLEQQEVRKPRSHRLEFPAYESNFAPGLAVSARNAAVPGRLTRVSFDLERGEHLLVTGGNGSGKSTLLNWIAAGTPPAHSQSTGAIVRDEPIGIVPQRLPAESDPGFESSLWRAGIGERGKGILHPAMWTTPIPELSAGNQRRAQLASVLANHPALLVLDEPTNYLDLDTMHALENALRTWHGTLVAASHDRWLIEHWHGRRLQLTP
ncbi:ABC-F family ATP-binding cassette domain-containing protein [Arcanobacterium hippocoleae]